MINCKRICVCVFSACIVMTSIAASATTNYDSKEQVSMANDIGKKLIAALQKDGLLDVTKSYTIKVKDGELIINDVLQPKTVYQKYSSFLDHQVLNIKSTVDKKDCKPATKKITYL